MTYSDHDKVSAIRYTPTTLSIDGFSFDPKGLWTPIIDADNPAYQSMFKPFNLKQYLYVRPPIDMGLMEDIPSNIVPNVLRMPIKYPGTPYYIPNELKRIIPLINRISEYEAFINQWHNDCFCHLTFDYSDIEPGTYHRFPGFHGDGIQGTKLTPKVNVEHSYILTTAIPTEFCLQPFFLSHLDEAKHNFFLEFDKQAKEENVYGTIPNHLYLIDPYMVHRTPKIKKKCRRLFMRITYAFSELEHPKNTINPMFTGQVYEKRIDIRENLTRNEFDVPLHLYGLSKV